MRVVSKRFKIVVKVLWKMHVTGSARRREAKRVSQEFKNPTLAFVDITNWPRLMSMHALSFSLTLDGVIRIHDAVLCLAKFSEVVSLEARKDRVRSNLFTYFRYPY